MKPMKIVLKLLICLIFLVNNESLNAQSYKYKIFELNKVVTFNDVVNFIKDKSKIITDPSGYTLGEDIEFKDDFNTTTTFKFYENTQILKCIFVHDITNTAYLEQLRQTVFMQLGNPFHGYEIKITNDVKDNSVMADFVTFDNEYKYICGNRFLDFRIHSGGLRSTSKKVIPIFSFSVCCHEIQNNYDLNVNYPSLNNNEFDWFIERYVLLNKW
jgi:hypothetical protein